MAAGTFSPIGTDIFGEKEVGIGEVVGKEDQSNKKVIWDGHSSSIAKTAQHALEASDRQRQSSADSGHGPGPNPGPDS